MQSDILAFDCKVLNYAISEVKAHTKTTPLCIKVSKNRLKAIFRTVLDKQYNEEDSESYKALYYEDILVVDNGIEYFDNSPEIENDSIELVGYNFTTTYKYNWILNQLRK